VEYCYCKEVPYLIYRESNEFVYFHLIEYIEKCYSSVCGNRNGKLKQIIAVSSNTTTFFNEE
jgi:hypothetical protein